MHSWAGGGDEPHWVRLSPAQPVQLVDAPVGAFQRLRVRVTEIRNPNAGLLGIQVAIVSQTTQERREIGRFSVFPAEQTGDYVLPLTASVTAALGRAGAQAEFALTADTTEDPDLQVVLTPIWE